MLSTLLPPMHRKGLKKVSHEIRCHETKKLHCQISFFRLCMSLDLLVFKVHKFKYIILENLPVFFVGFFTL